MEAIMILCNFNINNLFVRYKFGRTFPGDMSKKSLVEDERFGYLPMYQKGSFEIFNEEQRNLAALALTRGGKTYPDVICLQEVESMIALRAFNEQFLKSAYPYSLVIDSHDLRQIDVGILSMYPIVNIRTHMDDKDNDNEYVFSRDCLEATIQLKKDTELTLFINHFKSKLVQGKTAAERQHATERANMKRKKQAESVKNIVKKRFAGSEFSKRYFAVLGDFNDMPQSKLLVPIVKNAGLIDALASKIDAGDRWTHYYKSEGSVSQLDHILLSPALAKKLKSVEIERRGIGFKSLSKKDSSVVFPQIAKLKRSDNDKYPLSVDFQFKRFKNVSIDNVSSDHCPVFLDLEIG
jgi:endonuclease/exonuclease/phosphatase family metal-dependent hydrolase